MKPNWYRPVSLFLYFCLVFGVGGKPAQTMDMTDCQMSLMTTSMTTSHKTAKEQSLGQGQMKNMKQAQGDKTEQTSCPKEQGDQNHPCNPDSCCLMPGCQSQVAQQEIELIVVGAEKEGAVSGQIEEEMTSFITSVTPPPPKA